MIICSKSQWWASTIWANFWMSSDPNHIPAGGRHFDEQKFVLVSKSRTGYENITLPTINLSCGLFDGEIYSCINPTGRN